ncbi:MAG: DUF4184 family protein [Spirochaetales bacterium]|nr:DUF4184 family protein [Spirochaetales bacterium]
MPFTFAHPLAVLPLGKKKNRYFNMTALIIGSMAPDFEYFIHFKPYQIHGHTILGQVYYNLPLVILLSFIYHHILKESMIIHLPNPYGSDYYYLVKEKRQSRSMTGAVVFIYSAFIGMFTHLIWDSFTHVNGYFVTRISLLSKELSIMNYDIPVYKVLQHGSTILGLSILFIVLLKLRARQTTSSSPKVSRGGKFLFWLSVIGIAFLVEFTVIFILKDLSIGRLIVGIINGGFLGLLIASFLDKLLRLKKHRKQSHVI